MAVEGSIIIETGIDTAGITQDAKKLKPEVDKAAKSAKGLGDAFEDAGKKGSKSIEDLDGGLNDLRGAIGDVVSALGISFGLDSLKDFGAECISAAADLTEVQNVVDTAFGAMSDRAEEFAATSIQSFGMSELAAKQTSSRYMAMGTAMGIAKGQAADMAITIAGLSGDMASFYNVEQSVASTALASIWTGETESLKQYGIVMTQANLDAYAMAEGLGKTTAEMTQAEQVQLRYNYILQQTALAQGDFAKTSDSWANQQRILGESMTALSASIGEDLMAEMTPLLQVVNDIVASLIDLQENTGAISDFFTILIGGVAGLATYKAADIIAGVALSIMEMGSAAALANIQGGMAAIALGALVAVVLKLAGAWDDMSGAEKAVAVLGLVTAAAFTAALAVGTFNNAATAGLAAAGIVAGVVAIMAAINSAQSQAQARAQSLSYIDSLPSLADQKKNGQLRTANIPHLATGAVIPANDEFVAVLGDQRSGRNLEAPESLIRQIVREESGGGGGIANVYVEFTGSLAQLGRVAAAGYLRGD